MANEELEKDLIDTGYKKNIEGMTREVLSRVGDVVLTRCSLSGTEPYTSYETLIVQRHKKEFGNIKIGQEYLPRSTSFGTLAWSFRSKEEALKCFNGLAFKS